VESQVQTGIHYHLDRDGTMSRQGGAAPLEAVALGTQYRVTWTIVDPSLHVLAHFHTGADGADCEAVFAALDGLPELDPYSACEIPAPIVVLPRLFEPDFCDKLLDLYEKGQPHDSGFMRNNAEIFDHSFKRRRDYFIDDETVRAHIMRRISVCVMRSPGWSDIWSPAMPPRKTPIFVRIATMASG
jgi:hypothetical protein